MHYGGIFSKSPRSCYLLGKVVISDYCHPRNIHMQRFCETTTYLGLEDFYLFMYKKPDKKTNDGFELVADEVDLRDIGKFGLRNRVVDLYFIFRLRNRGIGLQPFVESSNEVQNLEHIVVEINDENNIVLKRLRRNVLGKLNPTCGGRIRTNMEVPMRKQKVEEIFTEEVQQQDDSEQEYEDDIEAEEGNQQNQEHNHAYDPRFEDSDYEVEEDSNLEGLMEERERQWDNVTNYVNDEAFPSTLVEKDESDPDWVEPGDEIGSDDLHSQTSSGSDEEDGGKRKVRVMNRFVQPCDNDDVAFKLGQLFVIREEFHVACKHHGTIQHKKIRIHRSNSKRCTAHCKSGTWCNWKVSINYRKATDSWELTGLMLDHTCTSTANHGCTTSRYLSKRYKEEITIIPTIKISQLVDKVKKDLNINISRDKAFNIKKIALIEIEGDLRKQYVCLRDYCFELLRTNPNSTVLLKTERNAAGGELFHRMYVCFDACKRGFVEGCRPLIGLDGCHLSGPHKGILLAAIGMDPNDQFFPVAYAVVEIECKSSWLWFLSALQSDLNIQNSKGWTLLSDKQKGLKSAMKTLLPNAEHRLCAWHMYKNFRGSHPGLELKELVWAAAKCTNKKVFAHKMSDIQKRSPSAYQWLLTNTDPKEWSRAHFSTETKCDILVNNIVECFNNVILHARDKPIITMLEALIFYFMDRLQKKRNFIEKMQGELGPKIYRKLEKSMSDLNLFSATHSGGFLYEVKGFRFGKYKVNLMTRTCGCNRWELTGIPCEHAIATINMTGEEPGSFIHDYYFKESYQKAYKYMIHPMNGPELWEQSGLPSLLPPKNLRLPGRLTNARKKDAMEKTEEKNKKKKKKGEFQTLPRAKRMKLYQCTNCKQTGHNIARCPLKRGTFMENTPEAELSTRPPSQNEHSLGKPKCKQTEPASTSTSQQPKAKVNKAQTCTLCGSTGHNMTTCRSSIANMKFRPPT